MIWPLLGAIPAAVVAQSIAPSKLIWVMVATTVIRLAAIIQILLITTSLVQVR